MWKDGIAGEMLEGGDVRVRRRHLRDIEEVDVVVDVEEVDKVDVVVVLNPHGRRHGCSRGRRTRRTGVAVLVGDDLVDEKRFEKELHGPGLRGPWRQESTMDTRF